MQHRRTIFDAEALTRASLSALRERDKIGALRFAIEAQEAALEAKGPADRRADALHRVAIVFHALNDRERCEAAARAALTLEAECDRPAIQASYALYLAYVLRARDKVEEAALIAERAAALYARALGPSHRVTVRVRADVARLSAEAAARRRAG